MSRNLHLTLLFAIIVCQKPQAQLTAKENPIPRQVQQISSIQDTPKKIKALTIGDRVPDFQLNLLNYSSPVANLSSFKGKLIILDFWASWCYSCLHAFPKLNALQKKFSNKVQFILVNSSETTGDNKEEVLQTVKKHSAGLSLSFLISYDDSIALKYFPHLYLPHYVWITPMGIVKAITEPESVTEQNIKAILEDKNVELSLPIKKDYFPDKLMDLALEAQPDIDENLAFYSVFKRGKIDGLSRVFSLRETMNKKGPGKIPRGISFRNMSLIEILEIVSGYSKNRLYGDFKKRLILEIKDSSKLIYNPSKMTREQWEKENFYTYDLVIPEDETENITEYIWRDLNKYSGYTAHIELRNLKCYILEATDKAKSDLTKLGGISIDVKGGVYYIKNGSIESLTSILDENPYLKDPVISKTNRSLNFDFSFDYDHLDINILRQQLAVLGLELNESVEPINVLVVSEKNPR
jgi:thiol-disulfide isomerase/thioredoxin